MRIIPTPRASLAQNFCCFRADPNRRGTSRTDANNLDTATAPAFTPGGPGMLAAPASRPVCVHRLVGFVQLYVHVRTIYTHHRR